MENYCSGTVTIKGDHNTLTLMNVLLIDLETAHPSPDSMGTKSGFRISLQKRL